MIISRYRILAITDRKLCKGDFLAQIEKIARSDIESMALREKDLTEEEYEKLAVEVIAHGVEGICMMLGLMNGEIEISNIACEKETKEYGRGSFQ